MGNSISMPEPVIAEVTQEELPQAITEDVERSLDDNPQDALARLRQWHLERDDSGDFRVYRDNEGNVYHSVTHILQETASQGEKANLARWLKQPGSAAKGEMARQIGTLAHENLEYVFKTARTLCSNYGNKANTSRKENKRWKVYADGLARPPKAAFKWAIKKAIQGAPKVPFAADLHARSLREWAGSGAVTAIHASEFSIHHPLGFAGTADLLIDVEGSGLTLCDLKTTGSEKDKPDAYLSNYFCQLGAYALGLEHLSKIRPKSGLIVIAKGDGEVQTRTLSLLELEGAKSLFKERMEIYRKLLDLGVVH